MSFVRGTGERRERENEFCQRDGRKERERMSFVRGTGERRERGSNDSLVQVSREKGPNDSRMMNVNSSQVQLTHSLTNN